MFPTTDNNQTFDDQLQFSFATLNMACHVAITMIWLVFLLRDLRIESELPITVLSLHSSEVPICM